MIIRKYIYIDIHSLIHNDRYQSMRRRLSRYEYDYWIFWENFFLSTKIWTKHYYSNGQLRLSTDYKKGLKHGEILGFYIDGTRLFTGKYKKDKMIGIRMYYNVDGKPANGEMIWRHENGVVKLTGKCVEGKPNGRFTHYDESGELSLQVDYLNGLPDGAYIKYENGEVIFKDCYKLGKLTRRPCHWSADLEFEFLFIFRYERSFMKFYISWVIQSQDGW